MPATMIKSLVTVITLFLAGDVVDAKLRGSFEDLKRKATSPRLSSDIRGKTLKELGVKTDLAHATRNLKQDGDNNRPSGYLQFFAVRAWKGCVHTRNTIPLLTSFIYLYRLFLGI
jgi:hypothetical protein